MRTVTVLFLSLLCSVSPVSAEPDPAPEAQKAAAEAAAERANRQRKMFAERSVDEARAKQAAALTRDKRKWLGSDAVGKSDGDVNRLYDKKYDADTAAAESASDRAEQAMKYSRANAQLKAATKKNQQEIADMSTREQEAWAEEIEEKMREDE